jgi:pimeloyl-ACP methyl ester carboxylesterase
MRYLSLFLLILVLCYFYTPARAVDSTPRFEPVSCRFETRMSDVHCGDLYVPEDRVNTERVIKLHVAIIPAKGENTYSDPIVYLSGGPGAYNFARFDEQFAPLAALYADRNLIIFDQRGVGLSEPAMNCPEVVQFQQQQLDRSIRGAVYNDELFSQIRSCRDRFIADGINLSSYNTDTSAADVRDLRLALGVETWNLYATSYGTSLALTVLRDDPEGVRSAVLDSPLMPNSDWVLNQASLAEEAVTRLLDGCRKDPRCGGRFSDLAEILYGTVDKLNNTPVLVEVGAPFNQSVLLDGSDVLQGVFRAMYFRSEVATLPRTITALLDGDYQTFAIYKIYDAFEDYGYSLGMNYSVLCADALAAPGYRPASRDALNTAFSATDFLELCRIWDVAPRDTQSEQTDRIAVPILLLVGEWDPIATRHTADRIAALLENGQVVELTGLTHLTTFNNACTRTLAIEHINKPDETVQAECAGQLPRVRFTITAP